MLVRCGRNIIFIEVNVTSMLQGQPYLLLQYIKLVGLMYF